MTMVMSKNKKEIIKFLNKNILMTLATAYPKPWVATVYFVTDEDFNFYFVSSPNSKHSKDIDKNKNVACAIYDSHTKNSDKKAGIQMKGTAKMVKNWNEVEKYLLLWNKKNPGMEKVVNVKNMKEKVISSRVYKITPKYVKFFNQELFGEDGIKEYIF